MEVMGNAAELEVGTPAMVTVVLLTAQGTMLLSVAVTVFPDSLTEVILKGDESVLLEPAGW